NPPELRGSSGADRRRRAPRAAPAPSPLGPSSRRGSEICSSESSCHSPRRSEYRATFPNRRPLHFGDLLTLHKSTPCAAFAQGGRQEIVAKALAPAGSFRVPSRGSSRLLSLYGRD